MNNDMSPNQFSSTPVANPEPKSQQAPAAFTPPSKQKKTLVAVVVAAVLLVVIAAVLYLANSGGIFSSLFGGTDQSATVTISAKGFSPQTIKVKKGQKVEWVNEDTSSHQVASDPFPDHNLLPSLFADSPLGKGESFSYTFDDAGTFTYHDQLSPADFKGTVIVE